MSKDSKFFFKVSNLKERNIDYERVTEFISKIHEAATPNSEHVFYFEKPYETIQCREDVVSYEEIKHIPFNEDHFVVCTESEVFDGKS